MWMSCLLFAISTTTNIVHPAMAFASIEENTGAGPSSTINSDIRNKQPTNASRSQPQSDPAGRDRGIPCRRELRYTKHVNHKSWREQQIACRLLRNYNWAVRPQGRMTGAKHLKDSGPVIVRTSIHIASISSVSDTDMHFSVQFRFQQEWYDERLSFKHLKFRELEKIDLAPDQQIWNPDTFFQNEKSGHIHLLDRPNVFTRITADGYVTYNRRLTMKFACNMNLLHYPHDTQTCQIDFASYAYTTDDIEYLWADRPVIVQPGATGSLPKFILKSFNNDSCTSVTNTGTYSCLRVNMQLVRVFSFFLLQLYIPSVMLVMVSYVSYWIDWRASPARVPLSIVTLLTMVTQSHAINSTLPPVSYTKAIDVWISGCIIFIFGSLIEYAIVNFTGIKEERRRAKARFSSEIALVRDQTHSSILEALNQTFLTGPTDLSAEALHVLRDRRLSLRPGQSPLSEQVPETSILFGATSGTGSAEARRRQSVRSGHVRFQSLQDIFGPVEVPPKPVRLRPRRRENEIFRSCQGLMFKGTAERIDLVSRILFPICFIFFNIVYWLLYW